MYCETEIEVRIVRQRETLRELQQQLDRLDVRMDGLEANIFLQHDCLLDIYILF